MKTMNYSIIRCICALVIGVLLVAWPEAAILYLVITIGVLFLVPGLFSLSGYLIRGKQDGSSFPIAGQNLVNNLKESNPVIVDELIPKLLGLGEIQKVLQNLLSEGISIRDLLTIFETLADHAQTTRDTDVLTEYVRQGLKRAISSKYFPANETTSVITLDPAVEQEIMSSVKQTEQGSYLSLDPDRIKAIIKSVETEIGKLESLGKSAIIITSPIVRMYFKKMTEDYFKDLIVLSYNEVESNVELQSVGMVTA